MQNTQAINVKAGNATATGSVTVSDNMPGVPCPGPAGYKYVGARYVPLFADPAEWNINNTYEPLTIVLNEGNSYTSKQYVPVGIQIDNEEYWALTGNYNAQVELYRKEVASYKEEVDDLENEVDTMYPLDSSPTKNSTKGVQSGGVYSQIRQRFKSKNMVVIGDSYSDPNYFNQNWVYHLTTNYGYTVHNYAKSGSGFVIKGGYNANFVTQANNAVADTSYNHDDVTDIVIYGGYNDLINNTEDPDEMATNAATIVSALHASFPYARIRILAITCGLYTFISLDQLTSINKFLNNLITIPNCEVKNTTFWFSRYLRVQGMLEDDKEFIHPSALGHQHLAKWIDQGYANNNTYEFKLSDIFNLTGVTNATINGDANCRLSIDENGKGMLNFSSGLSITTTPSSTSTYNIVVPRIASTNNLYYVTIPFFSKMAFYTNPSSNINSITTVQNLSTGLMFRVSPASTAQTTMVINGINCFVDMTVNNLTNLIY